MSVEFDPIRLGHRRRRVEPAVVGAVVMTIAIALAIAKPWESGATSPGPAASDAAAAAAHPSPTRAPVPTPRATPAAHDWTAVAEVASPHDGWGITAILLVRHGSSGIPVSPIAPHYLELWAPASNDPSGADVAYLDHGDRSVSALGVTVPAGVQARAVRIWRLHENDELEWMNTARIDDEMPGRVPLLVREPLADASAETPWDAGQYRVDVLTADGIHRISVLIPNRFGNVPRPDVWERPSATVAAAQSDPSGIQLGLFATVDGTAVSIPAGQSAALGELQAWDDQVVEGGSAVASSYIPRATGLGVMLTSHAAVGAASIRRLAPEPLAETPAALGGISNMRGRTPFVVFAAPDGVWPPGVYAVSVDWVDGAGPHHGTWHVELRPGVG